MLFHFKGDFIKDKYLDYFREMLALRGLTGHTLTSYCIHIKAYLNYLTDILHSHRKIVTGMYSVIIYTGPRNSQFFLIVPLLTLFHTLCTSREPGWHTATIRKFSCAFSFLKDFSDKYRGKYLACLSSLY